MRLCIFEDRLYRNFLPLVSVRPVFDLRCGATSILEKVIQVFPKPTVSLYVRDMLATCCKEDHPTFSVNEFPTEDTWFINGRVIADENLAKHIQKKIAGPKTFTHRNSIVALYLDKESLISHRDLFVQGLLDENIAGKLPSENISCRMAEYSWDLVQHNAEEIENDFRILSKRTRNKVKGKIYKAATLLNRKNILIGNGSTVMPGVVLDAEHGPIIIGKNVTIMPNAVVQGPAYIGDASVIKIGAKIYHGSSVGEHCKVGGEVEASVIQSYSNKQHDGFLGHSYLGSWVNLGADTNTSDLKNTYGTVKVQLDGQQIDTGLQFVGLTMGDHSKTGINVMFDTGTIVGMSCNIYGADTPPKYIPPFTWGQRGFFSSYKLEKSINIARIVMARRNVVMTSAYEELLRNVYTSTEELRKKSGVN